MVSKGWRIEFKPKALKDMKKLDPHIRNKIFHFLDSLIEDFESPRNVGKHLKAELHGLWRYHVGDHRIICQLQDTVLVAQVGHRKDVYETH